MKNTHKRNRFIVFMLLAFFLWPAPGFCEIGKIIEVAGRSVEETLTKMTPAMMRKLATAGKNGVPAAIMNGSIPAVTADFLIKEGALPNVVMDEVTVNYFLNSKPGQPNIVTFDPVQYPPMQTMTVGGEKVVIPPSVGNDASFFIKSWLFPLEEKNFPDQALINQEIAYQNIKSQVDVADEIRSGMENTFLSSLYVDIVDSFKYEDYLPSGHVDVISLGIQHDTTIEQDVVNWVRAIKDRVQKDNPDRHIYFATEYVWDTLLPCDSNYVPPIKIVRSRGQLRQQFFDDEDLQRYSFLEKIIEEGVPVIGIEPETSIFALIEEEAGYPLTEELFYERYQQFVASPAGMQFRNKKWSAHIEQIFEQDSDALVILFGGADHVSYASSYSVVEELQNRKFFTIAEMKEEGKNNLSLTLAKLKDRQYLDFVESRPDKITPDSRYVITFKDFLANGGHTSNDLSIFKKALGADVVVLLPKR